eukprot:Amastigsp_a341895_43.p1 type:complete len:334 gc:universal Amastigsp_a341895_43:95-1096(+)
MLWALVVLALAATASAAPENWMSHLPADATLLTITLPGTHDSGSYSVTSQLQGVPPLLDEFVQVADALHIDVGAVIDAWAKSQTETLYGQFEGGIRYADIRASWCALNNTWRTNHGVVLGAPLAELLEDAAAFALQQPTEVLVLEISHTESYNEPPSSAVAALVALVTSAFGELLVPSSVPLGTPIAELVAANTRVLVTIDDPAALALSELVWDGDTIINTYANSPMLATMESFNSGQVTQFRNGLANGTLGSSQLYKISWTLTPNAATVLGTLLPNQPKSLLELAQIANVALPGWVAGLNATGFPLLGNIFIIDSYETSEIVRLVQDWTLRR